VRYRRKYYATNRLSLSAQEVRSLYRKRQEVGILFPHDENIVGNIGIGDIMGV